MIYVSRFDTVLQNNTSQPRRPQSEFSWFSIKFTAFDSFVIFQSEESTWICLDNSNVCFPVYDQSIKILSGVFTGNVDQERASDRCPSIEVRKSYVLAFRGQQCWTTTHFAVESKDTSTNGNNRSRVGIKYIFKAPEDASVSFLHHLHPTHALEFLSSCTLLSSR